MYNGTSAYGSMTSMPPFYSQVQQPTPSKFITGIVILYFKLTLS